MTPQMKACPLKRGHMNLVKAARRIMGAPRCLSLYEAGEHLRIDPLKLDRLLWQALGSK